MTLSADLRSLVQRMIDEALPLRQLTVSAVNEDGTVNLGYGAGIIEAVPCAGSYAAREVGHKVWVVRSASGNWEVLASSETAEPGAGVTRAEMNDALDNLAADIRGDLSGAISIGLGESAAGVGYVTPSAWSVKDLGAGRFALYGQTAGPVVPPSSPPPKAPVTPRPVTVEVASRGGWRSDGLFSAEVLQGDLDGLGDWSGAWFYGSAIANACSGRTVASMALRLSRAAGSGLPSGIPVHLYLHAETVLASPTFTAGPVWGGRLEPGQAVTFDIPADWLPLLASGSAKGFGVSGSGLADCITFGASAGELTIAFAAA